PEEFDGTAATFHLRWSEASAEGALSATEDGSGGDARPQA
ncbi:TIGR02265 family protein, partial [Corallococcus exiguus]